MSAENYLKAAAKSEAAQDKADAKDKAETKTQEKVNAKEQAAAEKVDAKIAAKKAPACPDCGGELEKVGRTNQTPLTEIYLCHTDKKAYKGIPPVLFVSGGSGHPDMYQAIKEKHPAAINIEDVVLNED